MTVPTQYPYAAKAIIQHEFNTDHLDVYVTFRFTMNQDLTPAHALWKCEVDAVVKAITVSAWLDAWTILLTVPAVALWPDKVTLEYDGPDENLIITWGKQWEPWGPIISADMRGVDLSGYVIEDGQSDNIINGTFDLTTIGEILSGLITATDPTQQLKLIHTAGNYADFVVDALGDLAIAVSGTKINFGSENLSTTGTLNVGATNTPSVGFGQAPSSEYGLVVRVKTVTANIGAKITCSVKGNSIESYGAFGTALNEYTGATSQRIYGGRFQGYLYRINNTGLTQEITGGQFVAADWAGRVFSVGTYLFYGGNFYVQDLGGDWSANPDVTSYDAYFGRASMPTFGSNHTHWTIYAPHSSGINAIGGNLRIGDTTIPTDTLEVKGASVFGDNTNKTQISTTGDLTFAGSSGLAFGVIAGDDQTITCTTVDVWYQVTFDAVGDENLMAGSAANNEIVVGQTGKYDLDIHCSLHGGSAQDFEIKLCVNNCATDLFHAHLFLTTAVAGRVVGSSVRTIDALTKNDTLECWVRCTSKSGEDVIFDHVSIMAIMIGG